MNFANSQNSQLFNNSKRFRKFSSTIYDYWIVKLLIVLRNFTLFHIVMLLRKFIKILYWPILHAIIRVFCWLYPVDSPPRNINFYTRIDSLIFKMLLLWKRLKDKLVPTKVLRLESLSGKIKVKKFHWSKSFSIFG